MMKLLFQLILILCITSCSSKNDIPDDILSRPRMQEVLWDMVRADEFVLNHFKVDSLHTRKTESIKLYQEIFTLHKTTRQQFEKSMVFYNSHPEVLKIVLDSLEKRKNIILEREYKKQPVADSARKKLKLSLKQ